MKFCFKNKFIVFIFRGLAIVGALGGQSALTWASQVDGEAQVSAQHFANSPSATGRFDLGLAWAAESIAEPELPVAELRLKGFWEAGNQGDRSLELMPAVIRIGDGEAQLKNFYGHLWLGRAHPWSEAHQGEKVDFRTALGTRWVQNQSNPLDPIVLGWVGLGATSEVGELEGIPIRFTLAFSPLFLPSFGPRVDYSENQVASGSRFGRRPPSSVQLESGSQLPMRYRIETGDVKEIIFQNQIYFSSQWGNDIFSTEFLGWSAPSPDPTVAADGRLKVTSNDANILVVAKPKFERQNIVGIRFVSKEVWSQPDVQVLEELVKNQMILSFKNAPSKNFDLGLLHTVEFKPASPAEPGTPAIDSPQYAKYLGWAEWHAYYLHEKLRPSLRLERHFQVGREDTYLQGELKYQVNRQFVATSQVGVLAGQDRSFFGVWRSLDSASVGMSYLF